MPFEETIGLIGGLSRQIIGINAHLLSGEAGYRRAGIHQYILQILRHLPREEDGLRYLLYTRQDKGLNLNKPAMSIIHSRWPTERRLARILWEQVAWPILAERQGVDLLHGMAFVTPLVSPCPTIVTVYDLSFVHFPDRFPALQRLYLTSLSRRSCRQALRVITISESAREDLVRYFNVPLERIDVVRPGVDEHFRPLPTTDIESFRQRESLPNQFIFHVGTLQPRKNILVLLEAMARRGRPDLPLVLVGGKGWLFEEIFHRVEVLGLQDSVHFTGYVRDEDLPYWYNAASLLVFPSIYEGFGMPVVEAMACGTPVIAARTSSIPEATGGAAILFDPQNADELADRIAAVMNEAELSDKMKEEGLIQAQKFSWEQAGKETAIVYRKALAER